MTTGAPGRADAVAARPVVPEEVLFAVVAAHRTGQPLHPQLVALGARFSRRAWTAPVYRLLALPGPGVPRGGIVAAADGGVAVEVELHRMPTAALGPLVCALPAPLGIGGAALPDATALGIVCLAVPPGARDISAHRSWPAYLAATGPRPGTGPAPWPAP